MAGYYVAESIPYLKSNFNTATGKFDLYYLFLEQALRLLAPGGRLAVIVPNKLFHTRAAKALRELLATQADVRLVKDFGVEKVFEGATNYSCILVAQKQSPSPTLRVQKVTATLDVIDDIEVDRNALDGAGWRLQDEKAKAVFARMESAGMPLASLVDRFGTGVQTGADTLLTFTRDDLKRLKLEPALLRPLLRGRDVRAYQLSANPKRLLFPYKDDGAEFRLLTKSELQQHRRALHYLTQHKQALSERVWFNKGAQQLSGAWYGLMYVEARSTLIRPHLLTPALSRSSNFAKG